MARDLKKIARERIKGLTDSLLRDPQFREYLELQEFLKTMERLEALESMGMTVYERHLPPVRKKSEAQGQAPASRSRASNPFVAEIEQVLLEAGRPLRVVEIYDALVAKGVDAPGKDPRNNISAKLYYEKGTRFVSHGPAGWTAVQGSSAPAQPGASDNLFGEDGQT